MLLKDYKVVRPKTTKIQLVRKDTRYVYQVVGTKYIKDKKYYIDQRINIGKMIDDTYMIPNDKFVLYYPELIKIETPSKQFSDTLSIGNVVLINKILNDTNLNELLDAIFKDRSSLIKDLVAYMIIKESCEYEYFEYYERKSLTFTGRVYSDSTVSDLLANQITNKDINTFIDAWNLINSNIKDIYVNMDGTNFSVNSDYDGLSEFGHSKDDDFLPQVNLTYVTACSNNRPLMYELYPGSINDSKEAKRLIPILKKYNYQNIGFIFDRMYYSLELVKSLKNDGYFYIMAVKDNLDFITDLKNKYRIKLSKGIDNYLNEYEVSGISERVNISKSKDEKVYVYAHLFFNEKLMISLKSELLNTIAIYEKELENLLKDNKLLTDKDLIKYEKYFKFRYNQTGYMLSYKKDDKKIENLIDSYGYFALISEKKLSPLEALQTYRDRDSIEKVFRALKSSLSFKHVGVMSKHALESKVFLTFIASIVRNEISYKRYDLKVEERKNLTVPVIIKQLESIEAGINNNDIYSRRYAFTKNQKAILDLYDIKEKDIDSLIQDFNNSYKK